MTNTKTIRRSGAEIIAFHFCADISEVRDMVYQPTVYRTPRVYVWGEDYFCAPTERQKLPEQGKTFNWKFEGEHYGRKLYRSLASYEGE